MTLLWILLGVAIGFVALIVGLWLLLRFALPWYLRRKFAALGDASSAGLAARISLDRMEGDWQQEGTADLVESLVAAGFAEVGRFDVPEMQGMKLWAGVLAGDGVCAAVYDHTKLPPFFDVVRVYQDWSSDTVSSTRMHDPANLVPGNICHADPELNPMTAMDALQALPSRGELMAIDAANFVSVFTELYARSMDHVLSRQTIDAEQMRRTGQRMAELTGEPMPELDEEQMQHALEMQRGSTLAALETAILDTFLQSGQISAHEWEKVRDDLRIVHERYRANEVIDTALAGTDWDSEDPRFADLRDVAAPVFELFDAVQARLDGSQRLRLLGEVRRPVQARLYQLP